VSSSSALKMYELFYSGIDDALPSLVLGSKKTPLPLKQFNQSLKHSVQNNLEQICKDRKIPFIDITTSRKLNENETIKYTSELVQKVKRILPELGDFGQHTKIFGDYYPLGEFDIDNAGTKKRMPYIESARTRIPLLLSTGIVAKKADAYAMMLEGKKNYKKGKWGFPGGGWEYQEESIVDGAVREVREEIQHNITLQTIMGGFVEYKTTKSGQRACKVKLVMYGENPELDPLAELAPDSKEWKYCTIEEIYELERKGKLKGPDQSLIVDSLANNAQRYDLSLADSFKAFKEIK